MTLSNIYCYACNNPCSTLFVFMSLYEWEAMDTRLMNERFATSGMPEFGKSLAIFTGLKKQKIMFVRDDSVVGVRFEEFHTITPDDYMNFTGEK